MNGSAPAPAPTARREWRVMDPASGREYGRVYAVSERGALSAATRRGWGVGLVGKYVVPVIPDADATPATEDAAPAPVTADMSMSNATSHTIAGALFYMHPMTDGFCRSSRYVKRSNASTRAGQPVCKSCGSNLSLTRITFAVVDWRADGRYRLEDAVRTFTRESAAEAFARTHSSTHVVRTFQV